METRASYVMVGVFVLGLIAAGIVFVLWMTGTSGRSNRIALTVQFQQDVTGLTNDALVRYRGIPIGKVRDIRLDPKNPEFVLVDIAVRSDAQIYPDFVATMEQQGLTGAPFIQLKRPPPERQLPDAKPVAASDMSDALRNRRIPGAPTNLQKIFEEVPKAVSAIRVLAERATKVVERFEGMVASPSGKSVTNIIKTLEKAAADIASFTTDAKSFAKEAKAVVEDLRPAARELSDTVKSVRRMADRASDLADKAGKVFNEQNRKSIEGLLKNADTAAADIGRFVKEAEKRAKDLEPTLKELPSVLRSVSTFSASASKLSDRAAAFLNDTNEKRIAKILASAESAARDIGSFARETEKIAKEEVRPALKKFGEALSSAANTVKQVEQGAKAFSTMSAQISALVRENRRPIGRFMSTGLYEISQFMNEGRKMLSAFTSLIRKIENDPSRFFFGRQGGLRPRRR